MSKRPIPTHSAIADSIPSELAQPVAGKPDLDTPKHIRTFIDSFYAKVLKDDVLAHIFLDVAGIDVDVHIPIICQYWQKLLLGDKTYQRHTMNIHRDVHEKFPFTEKEFDRWLRLFRETAEAEFSGPLTYRAVQIGSSIAANMLDSLYKYPNANVADRGE